MFKEVSYIVDVDGPHDLVIEQKNLLLQDFEALGVARKVYS